MMGSRLVIRKIMSYRNLKYITIGYCDALTKIETALGEDHSGKVNCLGRFGDSAEHQDKYLGTLEKVDAFLQDNKVNMILYVSNSLDTSLLRDLMHYAKHNFIEFKMSTLSIRCILSVSNIFDPLWYILQND